jgi:hypothetical protein
MANQDAFEAGFKQGMGKGKGGKGNNTKDTTGGFGKDIGKDIPSYRKGGRVKKTGIARVHKNEEVLPVKTAKKYRKAHHKKVAGKR